MRELTPNLMSTPEALQEYLAAHEKDIDDVVQKLLQRKVKQEEIDRVAKLLAIESTAHVHSDGFTVFRDMNNRFQVRFEGEDELTKAA